MTEMHTSDSFAQHKSSNDGLGLGKIITTEQSRDAVHIAVVPMVAGDRLWKGQHVGIQPDGKAGPNAKNIGIVDPFLDNGPGVGERFWLFLYPGSITSLRHHWTHPDFPAPVEEKEENGLSPVEASRAWINDFAAKIDQTPNRLMKAAADWLEYQEYTYDNSEMYKEHWDKFPEFWVHYAVVTGKDVAEKDRESFFTCSC